MWERVELKSTTGNPNRELLVEKLGRNEEISGRGSGPELHHVTEANSSLLQGTPFVDLLNHTLGYALPCFLSRHH